MTKRTQPPHTIYFEPLPPSHPKRAKAEPGPRQCCAYERWGVWDALREEPGQWARIRDGLTRSASVTMYSKAHPGFEFAIRTVEGSRRLYARYVGAANES